MKHIIWVVLAAVAVLWTEDVSAGQRIYRWRDADGTLHFADRPPAGSPTPAIPRSRQTGSPNSGDASTVLSTRVPLESTRGAVMIPVWINGRRQAPFYLDTGATYCQITPEDARALNLDTDSRPTVQVLMANGPSVAVPMVHLDSLRIGSLEIQNVEALVGDLRLLGLNALKKFRITLDLAVGEVILETPRP